MRDYELIIIIHPDLDDEAINQAHERIRGWIEESGGKIENVDVWGKRRLAYEIQKQNEGIYYLLNLNMEPESISGLEINLGILEPVMRHLIVAK
jgi:small subunit ribosomal protein S6